MLVHKEDNTNLQNPSNRSMIDKFNIIAQPLCQVREVIESRLTDSGESVKPLIDYISTRLGKMARPALLLLAGQACGAITGSHMETAAIIELVHMATLLHDDVIDEAESRRNTATVNTIWSNKSAILLGDLVLSRAFEMCSRLESQKVSQILADVACQICRGELRQNINTENWRLSEDEYFQIVTDKTASLFEVSCLLGAFLSNADPLTQKCLSDFGLNFGIAFQIADDILDIAGDEKRAGKTLGTDFFKGKPTLAVIHLLNNADVSGRDELIEKLTLEKDRWPLAKLLTDSGSIDYARQKAELFCRQGQKALDKLPSSDAKAALIEISQFKLS